MSGSPTNTLHCYHILEFYSGAKYTPTMRWLTAEGHAAEMSLRRNITFLSRTSPEQCMMSKALVLERIDQGRIFVGSIYTGAMYTKSMVSTGSRL